MGVVGIIWRSFGPLNVGIFKCLALALGFAVLYSLTGAVLGVNRILWSQARLIDATDLLVPVTMATIIALVTNYFWTNEPVLPPGLIVIAAFVSFAGFVVVRYRSRLFSSLAERWLSIRGGAVEAQERVLIVGGGETGQFVAWWLHNDHHQRGFRIVGFVDDDLYKQDSQIRGVQVLGRREDILPLVRQHDVGIILFAIHNIPSDDRERLLEICYQTNAKVFIVPDMLANLKEAASGIPSLGFNGKHSTAANPDGATEIAAFLDALEARARTGDLQAVLEQIQEMKMKYGAVTIRVDSEESISKG
jgi:FlaA1/EpsC-like NDP-sugar epimerase